MSEPHLQKLDNLVASVSVCCSPSVSDDSRRKVRDRPSGAPSDEYRRDCLRGGSM